jgi:hypothetical protein
VLNIQKSSESQMCRRKKRSRSPPHATVVAALHFVGIFCRATRDCFRNRILICFNRSLLSGSDEVISMKSILLNLNCDIDKVTILLGVFVVSPLFNLI